MAKKTLKIADKPTLDEVNENVKALTNSKNMILQNIILGNPTDENGISQADSSYSSLPYNFYNGSSAVVYNNKIHILGGAGGQAKHYTIIAECYRTYENLYLFKNQKIYSGHKMIPIKNCTSYDDYLSVTEDGSVSFKIESAADNAVLTIV